MAKNPGRGNKIFRRNTIPNLVGQTLSSAQTTLTGLGYNYNVTNENTGDSNLNNTIKSQDKTGAAQLGETVNLVNYTFSFTPFGAFGFTPFGFTPHSFVPHSFIPFGAFGFTPWGGPSCIQENTLVRTSVGEVEAKYLQVGDTLSTINIEEIPLSGGESEQDINFNDWDWRTMAIETLTSAGPAETVITEIIKSKVAEVIYFNNDSTKKYSLTQPIFVKDGPFFLIKLGGFITEGNYLLEINSDGSYNEIEIVSIHKDDTQEHNVIQFSCEPQDWFIAGNYLVHNK